jgi:hypothetical protein
MSNWKFSRRCFPKASILAPGVDVFSLVCSTDEKVQNDFGEFPADFVAIAQALDVFPRVGSEILAGQRPFGQRERPAGQGMNIPPSDAVPLMSYSFSIFFTAKHTNYTKERREVK